MQSSQQKLQQPIPALTLFMPAEANLMENAVAANKKINETRDILNSVAYLVKRHNPRNALDKLLEADAKEQLPDDLRTEINTYFERILDNPAEKIFRRLRNTYHLIITVLFKINARDQAKIEQAKALYYAAQLMPQNKDDETVKTAIQGLFSNASDQTLYLQLPNDDKSYQIPLALKPTITTRNPLIEKADELADNAKKLYDEQQYHEALVKCANAISCYAACSNNDKKIDNQTLGNRIALVREVEANCLYKLYRRKKAYHRYQTILQRNTELYLDLDERIRKKIWSFYPTLKLNKEKNYNLIKYYRQLHKLYEEAASLQTRLMCYEQMNTEYGMALHYAKQSILLINNDLDNEAYEKYRKEYHPEQKSTQTKYHLKLFQLPQQVSTHSSSLHSTLGPSPENICSFFTPS